MYLKNLNLFQTRDHPQFKFTNKLVLPLGSNANSKKIGTFGSETLEPELIVLKFKNMSTLV